MWNLTEMREQVARGVTIATQLHQGHSLCRWQESGGLHLSLSPLTGSDVAGVVLPPPPRALASFPGHAGSRHLSNARVPAARKNNHNSHFIYQGSTDDRISSNPLRAVFIKKKS